MKFYLIASYDHNKHFHHFSSEFCLWVFLTRIWASGIVQQQYNADAFMYGLRMKKKLKTKRRIMSSFLICALKFISCLNLMNIHKHNQESVVKSAKFYTLKLLCDVA